MLEIRKVIDCNVVVMLARNSKERGRGRPFHYIQKGIRLAEKTLPILRGLAWLR